MLLALMGEEAAEQLLTHRIIVSIWTDQNVGVISVVMSDDGIGELFNIWNVKIFDVVRCL